MQGIHKKITAVFCGMLLMLTGVIYRLYFLVESDYLTAAAQVQGQYRVDVAKTRGVIYDRNMKPLIGGEYRYAVSVMPSPEADGVLLENVGAEQRGGAVDRLSAGRPFAMEVETNDIYAPGIDVFKIPKRYGEVRYAPHLLGYLGDENIGVAGLERAYNDLLESYGGEISVLYRVNAAGQMLSDSANGVTRDGENPVGGVVTTLNREIQLAAQEALVSGAEKGAAVVLDVTTGDILAMASTPFFDQTDIAASLEREDAPFINRALSGYSIGSVFKVFVAAAALENGSPPSTEFVCTGSVTVGEHTFHCNNNAVHGVCDMKRALEVSCNSYFINLAGTIPPEKVAGLVSNMGLGRTVQLAEGIQSAAGNLPSAADLSSAVAYANFSFGQGSSLASPLQIAAGVAAIANGGKSVTPRLIIGTTSDGAEIHDKTHIYANNNVLTAKSAETVKNLMIKVVEEGSGRTAAPKRGGAGGKTSSAQTGVYDGDKEIVHAWFAGFYPAALPKYAIVIFVEGGASGETVAAPIFKKIADNIPLA